MVRFGDGSASKFPGTRWSFNHLRELMPNADVLRGEGPVAMLPREERDLGTVKFTTMDGAPMNFDEALQKTYADGIVVLHKGKIVYERYFGAGAPHRPHAARKRTPISSSIRSAQNAAALALPRPCAISRVSAKSCATRASIMVSRSFLLPSSKI
jgi:hypothetical protein